MSLRTLVRVDSRESGCAKGTAERMPSLALDPEWPGSLRGLGEMGDRIRLFDWSSTPLGPIGAWPSSLRER